MTPAAAHTNNNGRIDCFNMASRPRFLQIVWALNTKDTKDTKGNAGFSFVSFVSFVFHRYWGHHAALIMAQCMSEARRKPISFARPTYNARMPYPEFFVAPMRRELTDLGVRELRTPAAVDAAVSGTAGTLMIVVN